MKNNQLPFFLFLLMFCSLFSCNSDSEIQNISEAETSIQVSKANFSDALRIWNKPENFKDSTIKTNEKILEKRLAYIEPYAKDLLLAEGKSINLIKTYTIEKTFKEALKYYFKKN
ncbi:hypothetical protein [Haloflavibacter putidus]|uniref:Lipoprotein n=1 Tax=Haloflavibacter putidus TaxID=2576776 RepID=A0A507ZTX6_9FLAO|nr:hypothetical protein [Haloflavibacter putidus]TQD40041.1 hypothetical protein FKR84_02265 [Haloflavibacter putidus]